MGTLFKLQQIPTWKIPNGNNKKKGAHRGPQHFGSHQFLIMECWGRGVKRPHWAEGGKEMLGVAGREAARCFPPSGHPHEPWGQGWAVPSGWGQITLLVGDP